MFTFAFVVLLQVLAGTTCSIWVTSCARIFVFVSSQYVHSAYSAACFFFRLVVTFLDVCFGSFRACFFCYANQRVASIWACSFSFFWGPLFAFLLCSCLYTFISHRAPLVSHTFLPMFLSNHWDYPCWLPAFFRRDHTSSILSFSPICTAFSLVFASLHMNAPHSTHANPRAPIQSHPCIFSRFFAKHDVRGNFPGHRPQIMSCTTVFVSACLVCVSPHDFCTPTHPCAPIHTHLHLFTPVYTLNFNLYMYNLIEKQCSNTILIQFSY